MCAAPAAAGDLRRASNGTSKAKGGPGMSQRLQQIVDSLGANLQRAVAIDDPGLRLLVYRPHVGAVDSLRYDAIMHLQAKREAPSQVLLLCIAAGPASRSIPGRREVGLLPRL